MKWLKNIFGKKEKPKDETPLLPIKDEEQPISVPIEENKNVIEIIELMNEDMKEKIEERYFSEPIAPTLERQNPDL